MQIDKSLLEALLNNIFSVFPDMYVSQHNPKDLLPVTFEESFKCLFVSVLGGNNEHLFRCRISQASNSWLCVLVNSGPPDQLCASEGVLRS